MKGKIVYAWITGSVLYAALLWIPTYGLTLAPIIAAIGIAIYKLTPNYAAGLGLLAGLTGYSINLAYTGGLEGLRIIAGIGGGLVTIIVIAYHLLSPALLAYIASYGSVRKQ